MGVTLAIMKKTSMKKTSHLIFVLGAAIFTGASACADEFVHKGWTWMYSTNGTSAALTNFTADTATTFDAADIPWKFSVGETEYTVTEITASAFASTENAKSKLTGTLTIPDSVVKIGKSAFLGCKALESITLPAGLTAIGDEAFNECESLKDIYFNGNKKKWEQISVGIKNEPLKNAKIHFKTFLGYTRYTRKIHGGQFV